MTLTGITENLQSAKILLLPSKYEIIFVWLLFFIAFHIVIALPTIATAIVVALVRS